MSNIQILNPDSLGKPLGQYSQLTRVKASEFLFIAGQVGWDANQKFKSEEFVPQFEQALRNVLQVLAVAGGRPDHICRITAYCTDKRAYLDGRPELGRIWRSLMGRHYPAMTLVFVVDLLDHPAKIELEATAVVPAGG